MRLLRLCGWLVEPEVTGQLVERGWILKDNTIPMFYIFNLFLWLAASYAAGEGGPVDLNESVN